MALRPPVPPRPYSTNDHHDSLPPPVPPLPPGFRPEQDQDFDDYYSSQVPHYADPLVAPRPQRLQPDLPSDMARTLDDQLAYGGPRLTTPAPPPFPGPRQRSPPNSQGYNPGGFIMPSAQNQPYRNGPSPAPPPPPGAGWTSPPLPTPQMHAAPYAHMSPPPFPGPEAGGGGFAGRHAQSLSATMSSMNLNNGPRPGAGTAQAPRVQSMYATTENVGAGANGGYSSPPPPRQQQPSPEASSSNASPALTLPLPTISSLQAALPAVQAPNADPARKISWIRDVLMLVNRTSQLSSSSSSSNSSSASGTDLPAGPVHIPDPALQRLADVAVPMVLQLASTAPLGANQKPAPPIAEAMYLRATLTASGAFPSFVQQNPRVAFREFEGSARAGHHAAWFRLGRDYETFGDEAHARECFERGVKYGVESCVYRMGMANLLGQLGLPANPAVAVPLLHRAATLASQSVPQPAYVYALLLLGDFSQISIPASLFQPFIPPNSSTLGEARKHLERAAFLGFAPAQYKLGHVYEFASPPFPFDALLSVQYYSLASQQGEVDADMALSKWFLCGSEGAFEKDEGLAYTFAEKAARKGLASAEFAMGYYFEVGIGVRRDVEKAMAWYEKAAAHGNTDASERINALSQSSNQALSRQEHDTLTENKLLRKRTQAKQRSDATHGGAGGAPPSSFPGAGRGARPDANEVVNVIRRNSQMYQAQAQQQLQSGPGLGPAPGQGSGFQPRKSSVGAVRPGLPQGPGPAHAATLPAQPQQQQHQQPPQQQRFPERHRYTLSDAGPTDGSAPGQGQGGRTQSPGRAPAAAFGRGRGGAPGGPGGPGGSPPRQYGAPRPDLQQQQGPPQGPAQGRADQLGQGQGQGAGGVKYNTFAEMGFQTTKLEEKECVIM